MNAPLSLVDQPARQPPVNVAAEQALLGAVLEQNSAYAEAAFLVPADFANPMHREIWAAIEICHDRGDPIDPTTLAALLGDKLDEAGGKPYLATLLREAMPPAWAASYARLIARSARARDLLAWCHAAADEAQDCNNLERLVDEGQALLDDIREGDTKRRAAITAGQAATSAIDFDVRPPAMPTGIAPLDHAIGGLRPGELVVLAGATSQGKSALALSIGRNLARDGKRILMHNLEMSSDEVAQRLLAMETGIAVWRIRDGKVSGPDIGDLVEARDRLDEIRFTIDDNASLSIAELRYSVEKHRRETGLDLLIVDYLQLMQGDGRSGNRTEELSAITRGLKVVAKDFGIPVVALSQINRGVENRDNKRPVLADLRESGSIEQDADVVMFCFRDAYYHRRTEPPQSDLNRHAEWLADQDRMDREAEIIIAKQRQGAAGLSVTAAFDPNTTEFAAPGPRVQEGMF